MRSMSGVLTAFENVTFVADRRVPRSSEKVSDRQDVLFVGHITATVVLVVVLCTV